MPKEDHFEWALGEKKTCSSFGLKLIQQHAVSAEAVLQAPLLKKDLEMHVLQISSIRISFISRKDKGAIVVKWLLVQLSDI